MADDFTNIAWRLNAMKDKLVDVKGEPRAMEVIRSEQAADGFPWWLAAIL